MMLDPNMWIDPVTWRPIQWHDVYGQLRYTIGFKSSRHFFIQSEAKPNPVVTSSHWFSRALGRLHVITSSFDWFTVSSDYK